MHALNHRAPRSVGSSTPSYSNNMAVGNDKRVDYDSPEDQQEDVQTLSEREEPAVIEQTVERDAEDTPSEAEIEPDADAEQDQTLNEELAQAGEDQVDENGEEDADLEGNAESTNQHAGTETGQEPEPDSEAHEAQEVSSKPGSFTRTAASGTGSARERSDVSAGRRPGVTGTASNRTGVRGNASSTSAPTARRPAASPSVTASASRATATRTGAPTANRPGTTGARSTITSTNRPNAPRSGTGAGTTPTRPASSMSSRGNANTPPSRGGATAARTGLTRPGLSPRTPGTSVARNPTPAARTAAVPPSRRPSVESTPSPAARSASRLGTASRMAAGASARSPASSPSLRAGSASPGTKPGTTASRSPAGATAQNSGAPLRGTPTSAARSGVASATTTPAAKVKEQQIELAAAHAERDELHTKVEELQSLVETQQSALDAKDVEASELTEALEAAKADLAEASTKHTTEHEDNLVRVSQLQTELEQARSEAFKLSQTVDQTKDQVEEAKKAAEEARFDRDEEARHVREASAERSKVEEDLENAIMDLETERHRRERLEKDAENATRDSAGRIQELEQEAAAGQRDAKLQQERAKDIHATEVAERDSRLQRIQAELDGVRKQHHEQTEQHQALQAKHDQLHADLSKLQDTAKQQKDAIEAHPGNVALAVTEARDVLLSEHRAASEAATSEHKAALQHLRTQLTADVNQLKETLEKEREEHEAAMDAVRLNAGEDHVSDLKNLRQNMTNTVAEMRSTHEDEISRLKKQISSEQERAKAAADAQKNRLELEIQATKRHLEETQAKWRNTLKELERSRAQSEPATLEETPKECSSDSASRDAVEGEEVGDEPPDWTREEPQAKSAAAVAEASASEASNKQATALLQKEINRLESENQRLQVKVDASDTQAEGLQRAQAAHKETELALSTEHETRRHTEQAQAQAEEKLLATQKELRDSQTVIEELALAQQQASRAQAQAEQVRSDLESRLAQARNDVKAARQTADEAQVRNDKLASDLTEAREQRQILEEALTATQASVRDQVAEASSSANAEELSRAQRKLGEAHAELNEVQSSLHGALAEQEESSAQLRDREKRIQSLEENLAQVKKDCDQARSELASVEAKLVTSSESQATLQTQLTQAQDHVRDLISRQQAKNTHEAGNVTSENGSIVQNDANENHDEESETTSKDIGVNLQEAKDSSEKGSQSQNESSENTAVPADPSVIRDPNGLADEAPSQKEEGSASVTPHLTSKHDEVKGQAALEAEVVALRAEVERLNTALETSEVDRNALQQSLDSAERKVSEVERAYQELVQASEEVGAAAKQHGATASKREALLEDKNRELRDLQAALRQSQAAFDESQNAFAERFDLLQRQQDAHLAEELDKADRGRVEQLAEVQQAWDSRCGALQQRVTKETEQAAAARKRLHEAQRSRDELQSRLSQVSQELTELKSELVQAKEAAANQNVLQSLLTGGSKQIRSNTNGHSDRHASSSSSGSWHTPAQDDLLILHAAHQRKVESLVRDHQRLVRVLHAQLAAARHAPVVPSSQVSAYTEAGTEGHEVHDTLAYDLASSPGPTSPPSARKEHSEQQKENAHLAPPPVPDKPGVAPISPEPEVRKDLDSIPNSSPSAGQPDQLKRSEGDGDKNAASETKREASPDLSKDTPAPQNTPAADPK